MMALSIAGAVVQGVGALATAGAKASAARYNAAVNRRNAQIALSEGEAKAADQTRKNEIALGAARAAYGAAGIDFSGDALGVYQDNAAQADYDLAKVHYDAQLRSSGYTDQAHLDDMEASADTTAGVLGAIGAGISGAENVVSIGMTGMPLLKAA
jgi:hypothetical protein